MSTQYRNLPDEELVHRMALKQDQEAFSVLFHRYKHIALGICLKYLKSEPAAKDAVQSIFLSLWTDCSQYEISKFKAWFAKVAKNHCLMELRKTRPHDSPDELISIKDVELEDNLHLKINEEQLLIYLNLCLRTLKKNQQNCINHFYIHQKSYKETSELTGLSYKEVKSHIQNGRRNLKSCLSEKMNNHEI